MPVALQIAIAGVILVAVWLSWPMWFTAPRPLAPSLAWDTVTLAEPNDEGGAVAAQAERDGESPEPGTAPDAAARASLQALAIVNPDNLPRPDSAHLRQSANLTATDTLTDTLSAGATSTSPSPANPSATVTTTTPLTVGITPTPAAMDGPATTDTDPDSEADAADPNSEADAPSVIVVDGESDPDGDDSDLNLPEANFPEVGQSEPDALTPFLLQVEIPEPQTGGMLPANISQPDSSQSNDLQAELILLPTATPLADVGHFQAQAAQLPRVEIIPAVGVRFTPTPEPSPTVTPSPTSTPIPSISGRGRLWSTFTPLPATENDHYWIGNPFGGISANRSASPSYQFGSTAGNRYRPHHGIDISNPSGTPIRAGVVGEVVHAGLDDPELLGPYNNFYGNTVVILLDQRLPVAGGELDVYVLYGHLSEVSADVGARVQPDDIVGRVGMTGIAIGPHLHVEVRLGANTYAHTVNPYLWMEPPAGSGTVAVRVITADGHTWAGAKVSVARFEGGAAVWARQIETYLDTENIGPDPIWGENGAMGDVPAGTYYLIGNIEGEAIRAEFEVQPGETTFIEVRTQQ